ncbi:MAG: (Fe-S)-binding protein [Desulfobacterales bacterium]|nr:(Fe-S)-binding protein [Desulfobacterales bacterium]
MLLKSYTKEIFRPECNATFQSVHCIAHLNENIGEVIPYLNSVFGGEAYTQAPPSVMFKVHGRLIAVHADKIAINALKDEAEADKILDWLKREINTTWENRADITPTQHIAAKPQTIEVLKRLPQTNCKECGQPTCLVFATMVSQGIKGPEDCPPMDATSKIALTQYLSQFTFFDV